MLVHKGHKIQLLPTEKQKATFRQWAGTHRWAWNWGLEQKQRIYETTGKSPGAYALSTRITKLKRTEDYVWLQSIGVSVPRMALQQLDTAYQNFFRRVKEGAKEKGFPRFKSRKRAKTIFHLEPNRVRTDGKRVRLPKIGWMRMTKPLRFDGRLVATVAVSERAGRWYVSLIIETEHVPAENQSGAVGIDLGIKTMAVLSDGKTFDNPRSTYRLEKLLARAQRQMARKQRGSNRWKKAKLRVQRIHKRIADARVNAIHQATSYIAREYSFVGIEDLNVAGMVKNHCLAKAVSDVGMGEFRRQVGYKVGWEQGEVVKANRWFPSSKLCNECGCLNNELTLADRMWICDCGAVHDRDLNASRNIRDEALRTANGSEAAARGGSGAVMPTDETRTGRPTRPVD